MLRLLMDFGTYLSFSIVFNYIIKIITNSLKDYYIYYVAPMVHEKYTYF